MRQLRGIRYARSASPTLVRVIREKLHYFDFSEAHDFYSEVVPYLSNEEIALLGCNDRYFLLTVMLNRHDAVHPWLYERCREVEARPDGYLDLWARFHFKSSIITFAGGIQEALVDPETRIAIFSVTRDISQPFLAQIKEELETNEWLQEIYPDVLWENTRDAPSWSVQNGLTLRRKGNPKEATFEAHGLIDAMPTGRHFPLLIFDDVITERNVTNPEQIQKATERVELADNLGVLEGSRKWFIGTRYCTIGSSRILMGDWSHKPISEVRTGDEVVGWELRDGKRYLRKSKVLNCGAYPAQPVNTYTLENGRSVTCTAEHKWWRGAHGGGPEYAPLGLPEGKRKDRPPKGKKLNGALVALRQLVEPASLDMGRDAGWLAGFFDGEGSMQLNKGKNRASGSISISQTMANPDLIEETRAVLKRLGFAWSEQWLSAEGRDRMNNDRCMFNILGGWRERYRFLTQISPAKRQKLSESLFAWMTTDKIKLESIDDAGLQNVYWLETETGNYVVEGFCSSNSYADSYGILLEHEIAKPRLYPATDDGTLNGNPVLLTREVWEERKKSQRSTIAAQMLQNPLAGKENTFRIEWLQGYFIRPDVMNIYILVDPSRGTHAESDRTAMAVIGIDSTDNKYLLDGYCHRMPLSERWQKLRELYLKWSKMPCTQKVEVGYERYGMQSDDEYFMEQMRQTGPTFDLVEVSWVREQAGGQSKKARVERLEPDFRLGNFYVPARIWHEGIGKPCRWEVVKGSDEFEYRECPGPDKEERRARLHGQHWRVFDPIRRLDQDGKIYDLTRVFFEEFRFFPFSPRKDLVDATSRIYDMEPHAPKLHERLVMEDYEDA